FRRKIKRKPDVLERVGGREGVVRKYPRHQGLEAVVAYREAVGRALRHHLEQQLAVDAGATADGERLGERLDRDEQHHVVEDLDRLPGTDRAAMGDLAAHAGN